MSTRLTRVYRVAMPCADKANMTFEFVMTRKSENKQTHALLVEKIISPILFFPSYLGDLY